MLPAHLDVPAFCFEVDTFRRKSKMCTSIVLVALLAAEPSPGNQATDAPPWQDNYTTALAAGARAKKPLAVFIGSGARGWEKLCREGNLSDASRKQLARDYICVYVDAASERGKRLARAFSMTQGLVLSTRDGEEQAFRHSGRLSAEELEAALLRHASEPVAARTETLQQRVSYSYNPATPAPAPAPARTVYPASFPPVRYAGFGGYGGFGGFGGGGSC
jgi:hypothetical protein